MATLLVLLFAQGASAQVTTSAAPMQLPGAMGSGAVITNLGHSQFVDHDFDVRSRMSRARTVGNPAEQGEGASLAKRAGLSCDVVDGRLMGGSGKSKVYEIACRDGWGWVLTAEGSGGKVQAYDCLALSSSAKAAKLTSFSSCTLPLNRQPEQAVQSLADKAHISCKVGSAAWLGGGGDPPISRYEMTCAGGGGYIVDAPQPGSKANISVTSCKDAEAFGMKCTLPPAKG